VYTFHVYVHFWAAGVIIKDLDATAIHDNLEEALVWALIERDRLIVRGLAVLDVTKVEVDTCLRISPKPSACLYKNSLERALKQLCERVELVQVV
jgi:hypothetical protein